MKLKVQIVIVNTPPSYLLNQLVQVSEEDMRNDRGNWCDQDWDQISEIMSGCPVSSDWREWSLQDFIDDYFQTELLKYVNRPMYHTNGIFNQLICAVGCPMQ